MSSNLERRYRRVLRLLPGWYRQQWEDDMVVAQPFSGQLLQIELVSRTQALELYRLLVPAG
jgi:hypothetical protein